MCSRCNRVVYPVEKLNCLDKFWHKSCFSCEVCQMALNMKTYKGYNKRPYCSAHYPVSTFTAVADTPENRRLKAQSENQSTVLYKKDFEKEKGKHTAVTDTPEMERLKKTQNQISNIKYHEAERSKYVAPPSHEPGIPQTQNYYQPPPQHQPPPQQHQAPPHEKARAAEAAPAPPPPSSVKQYRAMYDYAAADDDEVSFMEGDVILDVQQIDDGWMFGRVQRTGQTGMLPANYVE